MPVSISRRTIPLFIALVVVIQGFGHDGVLVDKRHSIQKGLSQSRILSIIEDQRGFMWFGTADGLNRYDGYQIRCLNTVLMTPFRCQTTPLPDC